MKEIEKTCSDSFSEGGTKQITELLLELFVILEEKIAKIIEKHPKSKQISKFEENFQKEFENLHFLNSKSIKELIELNNKKKQDKNSIIFSSFDNNIDFEPQFYKNVENVVNKYISFAKGTLKVNPIWGDNPKQGLFF